MSLINFRGEYEGHTVEIDVVREGSRYRYTLYCDSKKTAEEKRGSLENLVILRSHAKATNARTISVRAEVVGSRVDLRRSYDALKTRALDEFRRMAQMAESVSGGAVKDPSSFLIIGHGFDHEVLDQMTRFSLDWIPLTEAADKARGIIAVRWPEIEGELIRLADLQQRLNEGEEVELNAICHLAVNNEPVPVRSRGSLRTIGA